MDYSFNLVFQSSRGLPRIIRGVLGINVIVAPYTHKFLLFAGNGIIFRMAESVPLHEIIEATQAKQVKITDHADEEAADDDIKYGEICDSVIRGEIIRDYPNDKPYPSCLVFGMNLKGDPVQYGHITANPAGLPDPSKWIHWRERKRMKNFDKCPICGGEIVEKQV